MDTRLFILKWDSSKPRSGYLAYKTAAVAAAECAKMKVRGSLLPARALVPFFKAHPFPPTLTQARKPKVHPRVLESVVVDEALPLDLPLGTKLFLFESEADSEMVILCEGSRAAAKLCLDEYCKDGSEAYDLDDPLVVVVEG